MTTRKQFLKIDLRTKNHVIPDDFISTLITEHPKFKVGQVIEFLSGYNDDILYTTTIIGFDSDGDIYVNWDCYWFPIRDEEKRNIKLI